MERTPQLVWPPQGPQLINAEFYQLPLAITPKLWDELERIATEFYKRTALPDLVYGETDPASKSLRAVEGRE